MTLPIPNLDDRTFEQLVAEAWSFIPKHYPLWTDHNLSDPGIALLELFAFLTEAAIYQTNQIPERTLEQFAALVGEQRRTPSEGQPEAIEETLKRAIAALKARQRAITLKDIETLVLQNYVAPVARVQATVEVENTPNVFPDEQFVRVLLVPDDPGNLEPQPSDELRQAVFVFLRERCPITTRVRVVPLHYTSASIGVTLVRDESSALTNSTIQRQVAAALQAFISPLTGGEAGQGWPFGRALFRSELFQVIETVVGVDHVRRLFLRDETGREVSGDLQIGPDSLLSLPEENLAISVVDP